MTTTQETARLRALAQEYVEINEAIEKLTERKALIAEEFRTLSLGNHDAGDWTVQVQPNRRLNAERFERDFPVAQYPHLWRPTIDLAAVKENVASVQLDAYYDEGTPRVLVK